MTEEAATDGSGRLPLTGFRVLELSHIVAGPSGGLLLADLGADVIKVEEPRGGDQSRAMPNGGSTFYALNRNKRSLAVNLKSEDGREIFTRLVRGADVLLDNYAPGVLDRLGFSYEWGSGINPGIIYCAVKGFLPGPYGDRPLLDELAQMMGSMAYMTGPAGRPLRAGSSVIDIGAATYGVLATLAALVDRQRTGRGQRIQSGLFESTVWFTAQHLAQASLNGESPVPMPERGMGSRLGWGVYRLFKTADEREVFIAITSNGHWQRFCNEFGMEDLGDDPELDTNAKRAANRHRTIPRIEAVAASLTAAELIERMERVQVPYAPLNNPHDLLSDPQLNSGMLMEVETEAGATIKTAGSPVASDSFKLSVRRQPPGLGQHTQEILQEVGYSDAEIKALADSGLVRLNGPVLLSGGRPS